MTDQRWLDVTGAYNVRDLGGCPTSDGKTTRFGAFLRADSLHNLSDSVKTGLIEYGVRTVIDLRRTIQTVETPNALAGMDGIEYVHLNMIGDANPPWHDSPPPGDLPTAAWTAHTYNLLLDKRKGVISETLVKLANSKGHTAMYHCAAGTDRTGIISALLLGLADVSDSTIVDDYALSAHGLRRRYLAEGIPDSLADVDFSLDEPPELLAPPQAMELTLKHLNDEYGGIESYVRHIGLTDAQVSDIRNKLLE